MSLFALSALALSTVAPTAEAARRADVVPTLSLPASTTVYDEARIEVQVDNFGTRSAQDVELHIYLPQTNTSPTVHVLGDVGAMDSRCSLSDTTVVCQLGKIRKNRSKTAWVDLGMVWSSEDIVVDTAVATSTRESDARNNEDSAVATVAYVDEVLTGPVDVDNWHCTGSDLTAFYECTLYPSSISSHAIVLEAGGTIDFPGAAPGVYGGAWS